MTTEPINNHDTSWVYPVVGAQADRSASRTAVEKPFYSQVVGSDASLKRGLRPHPGFKKVHDLNFFADGNHDERSEVTDVFFVDFDIGATGYGYGFVYRAVRADGGLADVFVDFWNSKTDSDSAFGTEGYKVAQAVDPDAKMSVVAWGQSVYIFIEGRHPAMFFVEETITPPSSSSDTPVTSGCDDEEEEIGSYEIQTFGRLCGVSVPGPGMQPTLDDPSEAVPEGTLDLPVPHDNDRAGVGQIVLSQLGPCTSASSSSTSGTISETCPEAAVKRGEYTFAFMLFDSKTGRRSPLSEVAQCREEDFNDGVVEDDERWALLELIYDSSKFDQAYVYRSLRVQTPGGGPMASYIHLDEIVELGDHHSPRNGTGLDFDPAATEYRHVMYYYQKEDKVLAFQPNYLGSAYVDEKMPKGGAAIWFEGSMIVSSIRGKGASSDERNTPGDTLRGIGEFRYSGLEEINPELFPPINRYVPRVPTNTAILFKEIGTNAVGFSNDRMYQVRKENVFIAFEPMHEGYGIVGNKAADTVGSMCYFVTPRGIAAIDTRGALDDVRAADHIIGEEWAGTLTDVSVAFDPKQQVLYIHNPTRMHTLLFWLRTQKVTELHDTPFMEVRRGLWPVDFTDLGSKLQARAFFIQNPPQGAAVVGSGFKPRVFVVDDERTKVISDSANGFDGQPAVRLLDFTGDSRFTVADFNSSSSSSGAVDPFELELDDGFVGLGMEGAFLYVIDSSDEDFIGAKAQISQRLTSSTVLLTEEGAAAFDGLPNGSRLGLSPVYTRLVGWPVVPEVEGQQFASSQDHFLTKQVDTIVCAFSDVSGPPSSDGEGENRWRGLVYKGDAEDPAESRYAVDFNTEEPTASVAAGANQIGAAFGKDATGVLEGRHGIIFGNLSPGLEIFVPDLDYNLLAFRVAGKILASTRVGRPNVS